MAETYTVYGVLREYCNEKLEPSVWEDTTDRDGSNARRLAEYLNNEPKYKNIIKRAHFVQRVVTKTDWAPVTEYAPSEHSSESEADVTAE